MTTIRRDLQGLRLVAVIGVVVYHLRASWLRGGFAGVDVFFVLSGFFITGLLVREVEQRHTVDLLAFWGRRARRLLPAALLVLVTTELAGFALTNPLEADRIARDGIYATVFGMNWHEAASGVAYGQDPDPSPFQHYWSLGVEEQFYLAWPLLLLGLSLLWRWRVALTTRRTLSCVAIAGGIASFALALEQTGGNQPYAYYGTFGRVWQLAVGGLLAANITSLAALPGWARNAIRIAGMGAIVGFYLLAMPVSTYPGWWSLLPTLGTAAVVIAGEPGSGREPVGRLLSSRLCRLGQYSYGWYLWHWAPLVLVPIALDRPLRIPELVACGIGSLVVAVIAYHVVEDPVRRSRWLAHSRGGRSLSFGAACLFVGVSASIGAGIVAQHRATAARVVTAAHQLLTPQPAAAAKELAAVSSDGCQLPMASPSLAPECRYLRDSGHGDVVLVGDSHAGMWFPAVLQVARMNHWGLRVWARTSCPFAEVAKALPGGAEYINCDRWRADVIERLIADRPSLVVVAGYDESGLHVTDPNTGTGASQTRAHQLYEAGLRRNLARLRDAGLHVLQVRDVPGFTQAAPDCVLAHESDLDACSLPMTEAMPYGGVDYAAARAVTGVRVADFTDAFCHGRRCYQVVGRFLAYRDVNHLTEEMALSLVPRLDEYAVAANE